jgi:Response regulator
MDVSPQFGEHVVSLIIDIIDDDDAVRDSMHALLESFGFDVREYGSAEAFLSREATHSDCMLVDQHMHGMTGVDLLENLRARGDRTPALMITGRCDAVIEPRVRELGARVLHKPVKDEDLVFEIEQIRRLGG